jgi:hypothetical protein
MRRFLILLISLALFVGPAAPPAPPPPPQQSDCKKDATVYITRRGKKYHRDGCRYLAQSKIEIALKEAKAKSYTACKACDPPE